MKRAFKNDPEIYEYSHAWTLTAMHSLLKRLNSWRDLDNKLGRGLCNIEGKNQTASKA